MGELPLEIITEILTRLPTKPLIRFKTVSKPWNSLISSPIFIKRHLKQTLISNPNPNILISHHSLVSAPITGKNLRFFELNHPLKRLPHRPAVGLIESCNGVFLISDYPKTTMYLYNPSTNTHRLLPSPPPPGIKDDEYYGLGYDSHSDDYKVVRLLPNMTGGVCRQSSVYSLRNHAWKLVKDELAMTTPYFIQQGHAVCAKEMLHFVGAARDRRPVLICFDLRTESFLVVDYPELESIDRSVSTSFRELRGCMCVLVNYQKHIVNPFRPMDDTLHHRQLLYVDVWEMRERGKKESWVKLFRIQKNEVVGHSKRCMYLRLVAYSKDKRRLLLEVDGTWFGWYDWVNKRVKRVAVQGLGVEDAPYVAMTYVESLVSVSMDKSLSKVVTMSQKTGPKKAIKSDDPGKFLSKGFKLRL